MPSFSAEERQLLDDSLQDFLAENYSFERWKKLARGPEMEGFGRAEWARYAELGWLGVALPESAGGAGGGMTELGIVMAGAGRHIVLEPLLGTIVLGAGAIELAGTAAQRETLLPQIAAGKAPDGVLSRGTRRRLRPRLRARSRKGGRQRLRHRRREDLRARRARGRHADRLRAHRVGQGASLPFPRSAHRQRRPAQCRAGARRPARRDGQPRRCEGCGRTPGSAMATRTCLV